MLPEIGRACAAVAVAKEAGLGSQTAELRSAARGCVASRRAGGLDLRWTFTQVKVHARCGLRRRRDHAHLELPAENVAVLFPHGGGGLEGALEARTLAVGRRAHAVLLGAEAATTGGREGRA